MVTNAGLFDLPHGPGTLFNVSSDGREMRANDKSQEVYRNQMRMYGNVWAQYQCLEKYPGAKLVASQIHAGPGEIPFGKNPKNGVDLTVVEDWGVVSMKQFHGSYIHYSGHFEYCDMAPNSARKFTVIDSRKGSYFSNHVNYPHGMKRGDQAFITDDTVEADISKLACVKKLNAVKEDFVVDGSDQDGFLPLTFKYSVDWECQFFHSKKPIR